jgi:hypothetical protein
MGVMLTGKLKGGLDEAKFCDCLKMHTAGCTLVHYLLISEKAKNSVLIRTGSRSRHRRETTADKTYLSLIWNPEKSVTLTPELDLYHELTHAWLNLDLPEHAWWKVAETRVLEETDTGTELPFTEVYAVRGENQIVAELATSLPDKYGAFKPRTKYPLGFKGGGEVVDVPGPGNKIFDEPCPCAKWFAEAKDVEWKP